MSSCGVFGLVGAGLLGAQGALAGPKIQKALVGVEGGLTQVYGELRETRKAGKPLDDQAVRSAKSRHLAAPARELGAAREAEKDAAKREIGVSFTRAALKTSPEKLKTFEATLKQYDKNPKLREAALKKREEAEKALKPAKDGRKAQAANLKKKPAEVPPAPPAAAGDGILDPDSIEREIDL